MTGRRQRTAKDLIRSAALAQRTVPLCLRPDLIAQLQVLERQLIDLERTESASLGGGQQVGVARQVAELQAQMLEHTINVTVQAMPRQTWPKFLAEHPARDNDDADRAVGYNRETFYDALVRRSVTDPHLDEDDWARLDETISDGQWQQLVNAAWAVNARDVDIPFSRRASRALTASETG